jgi:hypothetical protein
MVFFKQKKTKKIIKFSWNHKKFPKAEASLSNKSKTEISYFLVSKTHYKTMVFIEVCLCCKHKETIQWNRIGHSEIIHSCTVNCSSANAPRIHNGEKILFPNWCWEN